jgi:hypothetical protein
MQLLHFSDTHDNQKAVNALARVAARWRDADVAITGDVCKKWHQASPLLDDLPNPHVWLVPGHHDRPPAERLGHLSRVRWQTPYLAELRHCALVGLDSEQHGGAEPQLQTLVTGSASAEVKSLIVLHHSPYTERSRNNIIAWAKNTFPGLASAVLLHGHEHHVREFFAEHSETHVDGVAVFTSRVYSANMNFGWKGIPGCANLITVGPGGDVQIRTVYDPEGMDARDGCVERGSWGALPDERWRHGRPGRRGGPPTYQLEDAEDPLTVIDEYWRWVAAYKA